MFGVSCCGFTYNHVPLSSVLLHLVRFSLSWGGGNRNSSWMGLVLHGWGWCFCWAVLVVFLLLMLDWSVDADDVSLSIIKFSINPVPNGFTVHLGSFSSVQSLSCVRLFATPWTAACQASLSITNSRSSPKLMFIESVMPSNHLILCCPLLLLPSIPPQHQSLLQWVNSSHEVAKVLEFQL